MPNTGPSEGSLKAAIVLLPILFKLCVSPIVTVDFPSPAGVGVIAVTKINFPSFFSFNLFNIYNSILALYLP